MSKKIKYPNGVTYIEGKLSSHEEDEFYRQMTPKRILCSGQVNLATSLASIANCHSAALGDRPPLCLCGLGGVTSVL